MIGKRTQYNYKLLTKQQLHSTCLWELSVKTLTAHACNLHAMPLAQLLLLVITRSRDRHVSVTRPNIKRRQGVTSYCPISKNRGLCLTNFKEGRTLIRMLVKPCHNYTQ